MVTILSRWRGRVGERLIEVVDRRAPASASRRRRTLVAGALQKARLEAARTSSRASRPVEPCSSRPGSPRPGTAAGRRRPRARRRRALAVAARVDAVVRSAPSRRAAPWRHRALAKNSAAEDITRARRRWRHGRCVALAVALPVEERRGHAKAAIIPPPQRGERGERHRRAAGAGERRRGSWPHVSPSSSEYGPAWPYAVSEGRSRARSASARSRIRARRCARRAGSGEHHVGVRGQLVEDGLPSRCARSTASERFLRRSGSSAALRTASSGPTPGRRPQPGGRPPRS